MTDTTLSTAQTILEQLGGSRFIAMTGARNLAGDQNSLQMKIGRNAKSITHVRITLNGLDLYDVEFLKVRKYNVTKAAEASNVYGDMLRSIFTQNTGLYTSL